MLDDDQLRRALAFLRRPDRLGTPEIVNLLRECRIEPLNDSPLAIGQAASQLLRDTIERLRPANGASRGQQLPYLVLRTRFIEGDGATIAAAAHQLGMSSRQLTREQTWAIGLLKAELATLSSSPTPPPAPTTPPLAAGNGHPRERASAPYRPEPIPTVSGYLRRTSIAAELVDQLSARRLVTVTGPPGIGKTTLVADLAASRTASHRVLWYCVRAGVNDSLVALLYELGRYTGERGAGIVRALEQYDTALATRQSLEALDNTRHLIVVDNFHHIEQDKALCGFLDEATIRLPQLQVLLISRHRESTPLLPSASLQVPAMTRDETDRLLEQLGVRPSAATVNELHSWTNGVPQLVALSAAWLKSSSEPGRHTRLADLATHANVQDYLLGTLTDLLDPDDRLILSGASIFRDRFSDEALAAVTQRSRGAVLDGIRRLVRSHVATRGRNGENAFFNHTVRTYIYDRLPVDDRMAMHLRAAAWYAVRAQHAEAEYHRRRANQAEQA